MTEEEMVGWHHRLTGHEFEQTLGDGEGQGGLVCCSPWGHRVGHNWVTEQCRDTRRWRRQVEFLNIGGNRHVMKFVGQWESIMFVVSASVMVVVMAVGRQRNDWGSRQAENIHGSCVCISQSPLPSKATYSFIHSVQFSLVAQLCPTLCDPMNRSMSGLSVHHPLPEFTYLSIITLNANGLNAPTKRQRLAKWIQKQDPYICCLQEVHLETRDKYRLKMKGWKKRSMQIETKRKQE